MEALLGELGNQSLNSYVLEYRIKVQRSDGLLHSNKKSSAHSNIHVIWAQLHHLSEGIC